MSDGPTGPVYPDWEVIQGEAFYVNRMTSDASYLTRAATLPPPITHPFPTCDCSACEIRRLKDQIQQLTRERDEAVTLAHKWWVKSTESPGNPRG